VNQERIEPVNGFPAKSQWFECYDSVGLELKQKSAKSSHKLCNV